MTALPKKKFYTPEEYLALEEKSELRSEYSNVPRLPRKKSETPEEKSELRSEYSNSEIIAMAGGSLNHARIIRNIDRAVSEKLDENCESITSEVKIRVEDHRKFYYPDVLVFCGEPIFYQKRNDTLINPVLIIEVLSDGTEAKDRGEKMLAYRTLESLREYVLISQNNATVEQYIKNADENWIHKATIGLKSKFDSNQSESN